MRIDWPVVLLELWESGGSYKTSFVEVAVQREFITPYCVTTDRSRRFRTAIEAINYLEHVERKEFWRIEDAQAN